MDLKVDGRRVKAMCFSYKKASPGQQQQHDETKNLLLYLPQHSSKSSIYFQCISKFPIFKVIAQRHSFIGYIPTAIVADRTCISAGLHAAESWQAKDILDAQLISTKLPIMVNSTKCMLYFLVGPASKRIELSLLKVTFDSILFKDHLMH